MSLLRTARGAFGAAMLLAPGGCDRGNDVPAPPTPKEARELLCWREARPVAVEDEPAPDASCRDNESSFQCYGNWAARCDKGELTSLTNCRVEEKLCTPTPCQDKACKGGCTNCVAGAATCDGPETVRLCRGDGSGYEDAQHCDVGAGEACSIRTGRCENLCERAVAERSYIGCEYWAVATSNSYLTGVTDEFGRRVDPDAPVATRRLCDIFPFALVITNAEGVDAHITIENPTEETRTVTLASGAIETLEFPCRDGSAPADALKPSSVLLGPGGPLEVRSRRSSEAAHHITSDVPITVYQFNPLEYEAVAAGNTVNSFTNDASMLLPVHTLTGNYTVMTRPTWSVEERLEDEDLVNQVDHPGFVAITGTSETPTRVTITSSAHTLPSEDGTVPALSPGQSFTTMLAKGETLQLLSGLPDACRGEPSEELRSVTVTYCDNGRDYDLTGTRIRADQPVSVIGGHDCTYIPRDIAACDHLEETMFPEEALGKQALVTVAEAVTCNSAIPTVVRVLSASDGNRIRFNPPLQEPVTLERGESFEFEALKDVLIEAEDPILVGQFLVGQQYGTGNIERSDDLGDPAFALIAPLEQWRDHYTILVPETLPNSFVNVVSRKGASITLDGVLLGRLSPIGDTDFVAARVRLETGAHVLRGGSTFGITVYGYAAYTSYLIPGGLDLTLINDVK